MKKKTAIAKPTQTALVTEQSLHFHGLLIDPQTGQKNEYTLSLEAHWFLRVILNEVIKDPDNNFFKFEHGTYDPLWFRFTSTFVRSVTRPDFSNAAQLKAFKELIRWQIINQFIWDPKKGRDGGWVLASSIEGAPFLAGWKLGEWKALGAKRKADEKNTQIEFVGMINPVAGFLARNNVFFHRIHEVPRLACRMKKGAQLLYHQALPFVHDPRGYRLTYSVACRVLGYTDPYVSKRYCELIDGYLCEIVNLTKWRLGKRGEGPKTCWYLFAERAIPRLGA